MKKFNINGSRFVAGLLLLSVVVLMNCSEPVGPGNTAPLILSMTPSKRNVNFLDQISIKADVQDAEGDSLSILWQSSNGNFTFASIDSAVWNAPETAGAVEIKLRVTDPSGAQTVDTTTIFVDNQIPVIQSLTASETNVVVGNIISLRATAQDPDGEDLKYSWSSEFGEFVTDVTKDSVLWRASTFVQENVIKLTVSDESGSSISEEVIISVFQELGSVWVADTFNDEIVKLSSNGTQLFRVGGFNRPVKVIQDLDDRTIWVADQGNNRIVKYNSDGNLLFEVTGFDRPTGLAVQSNSDIWVSHMGDTSQVVEVSHKGEILKSLKGFEDPQALDIRTHTGDLWVTDTGNNRIVMFNQNVPNGYDLDSVHTNEEKFDIVFTGYTQPEAIVVNQATGDCWVADTGNHRVVRISGADLSEFVISGFRNPRGIDVNINDGSAWVANTGDNEVVKIYSDIFRHPISLPWSYHIDNDAGSHVTLRNYSLPWAVSVNSSDGTVWFSDDFKVVKIIDDGTEIEVVNELVNYNAPRSLAVNTGIKP